MERLTIQFKVNKKPYEVDVATNNADYVTAGFNSWVYRTKKYTTESLCEYVNSKEDQNILCIPFNQIKSN